MDNEQKALALDEEANKLIEYGNTIRFAEAIEVFSEAARLQLQAFQLRATSIKDKTIRHSNEGWVLIGRYIKQYPDDLHLVFQNDETILDIPEVPDIIWCAFDGIKLKQGWDR